MIKSFWVHLIRFPFEILCFLKSCDVLITALHDRSDRFHRKPRHIQVVHDEGSVTLDSGGGP